jgi:multidrug efflux pump subunit AcrB
MSETILTNMARGTEPPEIISYNAANVPVAQLNVSSDTKPVSQVFDYTMNFMRLQLFTIPGFSSPAPLGGVARAVMVNIDPTELYANNVSANDLGTSLATSKRDHSVWDLAHGPFRVQRRYQHEPHQGCRLQ